MRTDENGRRTVERREDIPAFASESEERAFWKTHTIGGALLDEMGAMDEWPRRPAQWSANESDRAQPMEYQCIKLMVIRRQCFATNPTGQSQAITVGQ